MKKSLGIKRAAVFAAALFAQTIVFGARVSAQPRFSSQGHKAPVTAIFADAASKREAFWSVGQDGFIIRWQDGIGERFQASDKKILLAAQSPSGKEIAFYESDGGVYHSVKIWDAQAKKNKRSILFKAPVTSLSYSAKGTYVIATTSERNGVWFYNASNGKPFTKIKDFGMTASWAKTSESEKNVLLYSAQDGTLAYFSFKTGKAIKKIQTEAGLEKPLLFAKNKFLASAKNGAITIVSAENGAKVKTVPAKAPVILEAPALTAAEASTEQSSETEAAAQSLCYIDGSNNLYSLYAISITESGLKGPLIAKNIKAESSQQFCAAFAASGAIGQAGAEGLLGSQSGAKIYLGSQNGNIFCADASPNGLPAPLALISNEVYQKIFGVCSDSKSVYLLTESSILKTDYESKTAERFENSRGWTKIDCAFGKLILRNDDRRSGLYAVDAQSGQAEFLFDTPNRVKKIKAATINKTQGFLEVENSKVNFYSFKTKELSELYLGSGIQDAAAIDESLLAVAKTASSNPPSALVLVNLKTRETVPAKIDGDIAVSLEESGGYLFGSRLIGAGGGYTTSVFCMGAKSLALKELAASPKEEADAFVRADFPLVFTKVGSKDISVINVKSLKKHSLKSGSSFAVDMAKADGRLASLNEDSSITWYNVEQPLPLAEWYIDSKGQIVEF